jgi:hypothetical protein
MLLVTCMLLHACTENNARDYCQDHYLFHQNHGDTIGLLTINLPEDGRVASDLKLPVSIFEGSNRLGELKDYLQQADNIYTLNTAQQCEVASSTVSMQSGTISASFESRCGAGNKIGQVDVLIFDSSPELEEVEVLVTTPATSKHFAISRQCDAAIFRLDHQ